jgi:hypothetical protein
MYLLRAGRRHRELVGHLAIHVSQLVERLGVQRELRGLDRLVHLDDHVPGAVAARSRSQGLVEPTDPAQPPARSGGLGRRGETRADAGLRTCTAGNSPARRWLRPAALGCRNAGAAPSSPSAPWNHWRQATSTERAKTAAGGGWASRAPVHHCCACGRPASRTLQRGTRVSTHGWCGPTPLHRRGLTSQGAPKQRRAAQLPTLLAWSGGHHQR